VSVIGERYEQLGGATGFLGAPVSDEQRLGDGPSRYCVYQRGAIYWTVQDLKEGNGLTTQTYEVHGEIWKCLQALGPDFVGCPLSDETVCPDGRGRFNRFQRGSIYWTLETQAHEVHGGIHDKWCEIGREQSALGYPITNELRYTTEHEGIRVPTGIVYNRFEHGTISWHADGAHVTYPRERLDPPEYREMDHPLYNKAVFRVRGLH